MSRVFLIGFMGAGKSTVGRIVARELSLPFVDLDAEIEREAGAAVAEVFEAEGEERFRELERGALQRVASGPDAVVACGGGVVLDPRNRETLASAGTVVLLAVGAEEAVSRIRDAASRPLLAGDPLGRAASLLAERMELYRAAADVAVDTTGLTQRDVAAEVLSALAARDEQGGAA